MKNRATGTFQVKAWDEKPYHEGPKLTRASVKYEVHGDLEGELTSESLMVYGADGSANYLMLDLFVGTLAGKSGSFVLQGGGTYDPRAGGAKWTSSVTPGSATDGLDGLRGTVDFSATHTPPGNFTLDYEWGN
jgi:hypothetical protein